MFIIAFMVVFGIIGTLFVIALSCDLSLSTKKPIKYREISSKIESDYDDSEKVKVSCRRVTILPSGFKLRTYKLVIRENISGIKKKVEHEGIDALTVVQEYNRLFNKERNFVIMSVTEV